MLMCRLQRQVHWEKWRACQCLRQSWVDFSCSSVPELEVAAQGTECVLTVAVIFFSISDTIPELLLTVLCLRDFLVMVQQTWHVMRQMHASPGKNKDPVFSSIDLET